MVVKRKDFQKTALYLHELLLKLGDESDCAELRDSLNLTLLHMQRYFQVLRQRRRTNSSDQFGSTSSTFGEGSLRGLSPMTPYQDKPEKFTWHWRKVNRAGESMDSGTLRQDDDQLEVRRSPLLRAVEDGDMEMITALCRQDRRHLQESDAFNRNSVMYAVKFRQMEALKWILEEGANVNHPADDGSTALIIASFYDNQEAVDILLRYGAEVNAQDALGRAAIHWACTIKSVDCLKSLIQFRANVNIHDEDGLTPAMWSCRVDNIEHFQILSGVANQKIDEPDGIERDNYGRTWLHWAVRMTEPLECLSTLLTEETAVLRDDSGKTVMLVAAETGSLAACRVIVGIVGTDCIHDRDDLDRTPLHLATLGGHGEVVNFLMEKGGDLEARDKNNCTAWTYANSRHLHYCKLIISSHYRQRSRSIDSRASTQTNSTMNSGWMTKKKKPLQHHRPEDEVFVTDPYPLSPSKRNKKKVSNFVMKASGEGVRDDVDKFRDSPLQEEVQDDAEWKPRTPPRPPKTPPLKMERSPTLRRSLKRPSDAASQQSMEENSSLPAQSAVPSVGQHRSDSFDDANTSGTLVHRKVSDDMGYETVNNGDTQEEEAGASHRPGKSTDVVDWSDREVPTSNTKVLVIHADSTQSRSPENEASGSDVPPAESPSFRNYTPQQAHSSRTASSTTKPLSRSQPPPRLVNHTTNDQEQYHSNGSSAQVPQPKQRQRMKALSTSSENGQYEPTKPPETPPEMRRRPTVPAQLLPLESVVGHHSYPQPIRSVSSEDVSNRPVTRHGAANSMKKPSKKRRTNPQRGSDSVESLDMKYPLSGAWTGGMNSATERAVIEESLQVDEKFGNENGHKFATTLSGFPTRQARILNPPPMTVSPRNPEPSGPPVLQPDGPGHSRQSQLLSSASLASPQIVGYPHDPQKGPVPPVALSPLDSLRNPIASWNTHSGAGAELGGHTPRAPSHQDQSYDGEPLNLPPAHKTKGAHHSNHQQSSGTSRHHL